MKARLKKKEEELEKERAAHEEARRGFQEKQRELQRRASQLSKYVVTSNNMKNRMKDIIFAVAVALHHPISNSNLEFRRTNIWVHTFIFMKMFTSPACRKGFEKGYSAGYVCD